MESAILYIFDKNEISADKKFLLVKIGTTCHPAARKATYKTGCGSVCRYLKYFKINVKKAVIYSTYMKNFQSYIELILIFFRNG